MGHLVYAPYNPQWAACILTSNTRKKQKHQTTAGSSDARRRHLRSNEPIHPTTSLPLSRFIQMAPRPICCLTPALISLAVHQQARSHYFRHKWQRLDTGAQKRSYTSSGPRGPRFVITTGNYVLCPRPGR